MASAMLMPSAVPIVERAFQLAGTGDCEGLSDISQRLRSEGYVEVEEHLQYCPLLRRQLLSAVRAAQQCLSSSSGAAD